MTIEAIETKYNGYGFRSRLEARWAVFFDSLGIEYCYEHEGFNVNGTWYLPDFWLPQFNCWAEVKPITFTQEQFALCYAIRSFLLLDGMPEIKGYFYTNFPSWDGGPTTCTAAYHEYLGGSNFGRVHLGHSIGKGRLWFLFGESMDDYWNEPMRRAKAAAWEARFDKD